MKSPLEKIHLSELRKKPIMIDANIFMVGIENRNHDPNCSFENIKQLFLIPMMESFSAIFIHEMVYKELDSESRTLVDSYIKKNVTIVSEGSLFEKDPKYTTIFHDIADHELVRYERGKSKDRGEVYSLAYAAYYGINYFSSKEIMVDNIAGEIEDLKDIDIITFDIILLNAFVYHNHEKGDSSKNKALKSVYKSFGEDVIKRHGLPGTLAEYVKASLVYL